MIGECGRGKNGTTHYYYTCAARKKSRSCKKRNERKFELEKYIVEYISMYVLTDEWINAAAERVVAEYARSYAASGIKPLERQIREADKELDALVDTLIKTASATAIAKINERIESVEAKKRTLEADLATLRIASRVEIRKDDIVAWLDQFRVGSSSDPEYCKKIIELFVNAVYVYDDRIKMFFNVRDSAQITYPEMLALDGLECSDFDLSGVPNEALSEQILFINGIIGMLVRR